jgi:alkylhydroperoxidase family enzyme
LIEPHNNEEPMNDTHFTVSSTSFARLSAPEAGKEGASVRDLVARHHGENWIRALAINPETASRFAQYFEHLFRPEGARLPLRERELIAVVVSAQNGSAPPAAVRCAGTISGCSDACVARLGWLTCAN